MTAEQIATRPTTFAEAEAVLAQTLPGYESRPEQQRMARAVEEAIATPGSRALVEAGCGTGKSLGAMIPAILSGKRTVVATATKALMDQYAAKDIPFLQEHLGVPFTWSLLKGRSNYLCLAKVADPERVDPEVVAAIQAEIAAADEAGEEHTGDMDEFGTLITPGDRSRLTMSSQACPGASECPFGEVCFAQKAKKRALESSLVITNTAMLMTDLKVRKATGGGATMLGDWRALIIDEAHETEEIATNMFEEDTRQEAIERLLTDVSSFFGSQGSSVKSEVVTSLIDASSDVWSDLPTPPKPGDKVRLGLSYFAEHFEPYVGLIDALRALGTEVTNLTIEDGDPRTVANRARLRARIRNMITFYTELSTADNGAVVRWIQMDEGFGAQRGRKVKSLHSAPIDVAPILREYLWEPECEGPPPSSILISATMSVGGKFDFLQESLGLQGATCVNVGTPFDYDTQALLFVPGPRIPTPKDRSAWLTYSQTATMELINAAGGGALLLFTSRSAMQASYEALRPRIESAGYSVLMQGLSGPNKAIAAQFKSDEHSVLFALKSFFTGVDIPGNALRLVVIDKLPFGVPTDPVLQARSDMVEARGKSSFMDLSIPQMTLTLIQGYGRLIRTKNDRGVVAILDSRLSSSRWGKKIVASFPDSPETTELQDVYQFFGTK